MVEKKSLVKIVRSDFALLVKLNLIFLGVCIPVVTIGPALITLFEMVIKILRDEPVDLCYEFRKSFCRHLRVGLVFEFILFVFLMVWSFAVHFYLNGLKENSFYGLMFLGVLFFGIIFSCVCIYLLALLGTSELGAKEAVHFAVLLAIAKPGKAIQALFVIFAISIIMYMLSLYSIPLLLIIACSGTVLCIIRAVWKPIDQFVIK